MMCSTEQPTDSRLCGSISAVLFGDGKNPLTLSLLCQLLCTVPLSLCQQFHREGTDSDPWSNPLPSPKFQRSFLNILSASPLIFIFYFPVLSFPPVELIFFHFKHPSLFAPPLFSALHLFRAVLPKDKYRTWTCLAAGSPFTVIEFCSQRFSLFYLYCLPLFLQKNNNNNHKKKHLARPQPLGCL